MKWSLMMRDEYLQVNLEPENDHERAAFDLLRDHNGEAHVRSGITIAPTMGEYLRSFGDHSEVLAITIRKATTRAKEVV